MRKFITPILLLLLTHGIAQNTIDSEQAKKVAVNFFSERSVFITGFNNANILVSDVIIIKSGDAAVYYICQMEPKGFVIVSACSKTIPVLGYSFEAQYPSQSDMIPGIAAWFNNYARQVEYAQNNNFQVSTNIQSAWERLLSGTNFTPHKFSQSDAVEPLLSSKWNQSNPYNNWCPADVNGPGGRCYAGCVATAMGQLLYYYRFPQTGMGEYTYSHPTYGTISANFGQATYDWNQMPSVINTPNNEIGKLLFHQGVSVDMDYGPDGSGMWNHKAAYSLKTYFRYGPETQYYFRDSTTIDWDSLIIANLDQRKPLYYAGWAGVQSTSGHAFVCDGYQPGNYYHFNWGWGGSSDGYFYIDNLTPGGNVFNFAQEIIPLFPDTLQNTYPMVQEDTVRLSSIKGSVEDGSGWYTYSNNLRRQWKISPQNLEFDSIQSIKLIFSKFNLEDGNDSLLIYTYGVNNISLFAAYTGNTLPAALTIPTNKLLIVFKTNSSITSNGWQFDYECQVPVYCNGITTITSQNGILEDGSGEKKYSNNSLCRWKILPGENKPLTLIFTAFSLADSSDFVKVIDLQTQAILGNFTGTQIPLPITCASGKIMIMFVSNGNQTDKGWKAEFYASETEIPECLQNDKYTIYPNPAKNSFIIETNSSSATTAFIKLYSLTGVKILERPIHLEIGMNRIYIETQNIPKMAYFLLINESDKKIIRKKIIFQ